MYRLSHVLLAAGVVLAGFAGGRIYPGIPGHPLAAHPPADPVKTGPHQSSTKREPGDLDTCLCKIAAGNLQAGRQRIESLLSAEGWDEKELVKLLVAIAKKDGASFDAEMAKVPEKKRLLISIRCVEMLVDEPAAFLTLLGDSGSFGDVALEYRPHMIRRAAGEEMELFLSMIERGELACLDGKCLKMALPLSGHGKNSARLLALVQSGSVPVGPSDDFFLFTLNLGEEDLGRLMAGGGPPALQASLHGEARARTFFADFDPAGDSWEEVPLPRLLFGMGKLVEEHGLPDLAWHQVPENLREPLASRMLEAGSEDDARRLLSSLSKADIPASDKNALLEKFAGTLFHDRADVGLAVEFANTISDNPDGSNAGRDLIVEWVTYDPMRAKIYADRIGPSPLGDRILAKIREVSP